MAEEIKTEEKVAKKATTAKTPAKKAATTKKTTTTKSSAAKTTTAKKSTTAKKTTTTKKTTTKKAAEKVETTETVVKEKVVPTKIPVKANPKKEPSVYVKRFNEEVAPHLMKKFNYKSVMQIPHIEKIVLNMGVGDATSNSKLIDAAVEDLTLISGQKPVVTKAKKSIATFKVRAGMPIGVKVTLRGDRMYDFFGKLIHVALPRVRDFRGVSLNSFDGRGNYTLGIKEQLIFPEINYDKVVKIRGLDIVIVTTANTDEEARELLKEFGMPFER